MPRRFLKKGAQPPKDTEKRPSTFTPDKAVYLRRPRCLATTKRESVAGIAVFPVFVGEWKAELGDLAQAQGQALYSSVQAAAIYQNCRSSQQLLTVAVAHGQAFPRLSYWAGEGSADRPQNGFRYPDGAISFFLMVFDAAQNHVLAAFEVTRDQLRTTSHLSFEPRAATVGDLVDWRARRVGKKRKAPGTKELNTRKKSKIEVVVAVQEDVSSAEEQEEEAADGAIYNGPASI
ncbi:hypothetical protein B0H17DRAFT_1106020 [Mycena rosella]|uniref:Uncharacterized protein n=1 Tax=Mycena rosella TaxID=1033263 RepID=A0AAD7C6A4_MYCRO|nr:hypothetical protein B0H17DRAFT_1106020 [Mycena rosella]